MDMACTKQTANTVENNDWSGVSITGKDSKVTIKYGNYSKNGRNPKSSSEGESGHGVGVFSGATLVLKEATMKDNSVCGVSPFGAGTSATIEKCVIQDNGRHGIGGRKSVTLTVKGNTIKDNKNHGIMVNDKSNGKNIENNEISGNKQCGICVGVRSKATVKNNNISKSGQNAIYVYDKSKATITGGKLQSNKECGVVTDKNADVTVKKVNISKNKIYGMNIKGGKAKVQSCTISSNKSSGIQVKAKAKVSELSGNKIKNNGEYGIYCKEASVTKIEKNTITGHKKYGIVLYPGSTCKNIKKNTLSNPAAPKEIGIQGSTSNVGDVKPVTISTAKKNGTSIKGSAPSNAKVSVKIGKKTYSAKAGGNGSYTIKTAKLKKGTKLKDGKGNVYIVTKTGMEAEFKAPFSKKLKSLKIPESVKINGISYKVTSIAKSALKGCKSLKTVTIGKNIKKIGAAAFYNCSSLRKVTIKTSQLTVKSVGAKAFAGLHKWAEFKVPAKKMPTYKKLLQKKGVSKNTQIIRK